MVAKVPQTLEYRGDQLNVASMLEVENFTNWKKRFKCHIIGIEILFKSIVQDGPYVPMIVSNRKAESQWNANGRKTANLDQRLKSLIMSVLPDDQMNFVNNCKTIKATWEDMIIYHEGPSDVKESRDFQDSLDDEDDTKRSQEYMNDIEEEFHERSLLTSPEGSSKGGPKGSVRKRKMMKLNAINVGGKKPKLRPTKYFEAKYNKVKAKLTLLSSSASTSISSIAKNKGLVAEKYEWDKEDMSSDDNEMVKVKVLMALVDDENIVVCKESARNGVERPWLSKSEGFNLLDHDIGKILPAESQVKVTDLLFIVTNSSVSDYDSANESLVCSTSLPPLEKLVGAESVSGPKTIKSIMNSNSKFKTETLKVS
nr:hypothetical protein [Tanacetum cinerariifolium]